MPIWTQTLLLLIGFGALNAQDCLNPVKYQEKMLAADSCIAAGNYSLAYDNYNAAAVYCRDSSTIINQAKDELFDIINGLRQEATEQREEAEVQKKRAETRARVARANEIAAQGEIALREGDRTTAFQLGAFAHILIDSGNHAAASIMSDAYYYNDDPARNPQSPALGWSKNFIGHTDIIKSVAFSPDGRYVVTGSMDHTAKLWDVETGREIRTFIGHTRGVYSVAFSPDGQSVLTGSIDETAKLWDIHSGKKIRTFDGHKDRGRACIYAVAFHPSGRYILTGSRDATTKIWEIETGRKIGTLPGHLEDVSAVQCSPDSKYILSASTDGTTKLWNGTDGHLIGTVEGHESWGYAAVFSPDSKYFVSGNKDHTAALWDRETLQLIRKFEGHTGAIYELAFSPDGQYLVTASWDHTAKVWEVASGKEVYNLHGHTDKLHAVAFSPNNRHIITAGSDQTARLWDISPATEAGVFKGHEKHINCIAISPNGQYLATGSYDETTRIWDVQSGTELHILSHEYVIEDCLFSPDGQLLVTAGSKSFSESFELSFTAANNHNIRLWSIPDGQKIHHFPGSHSLSTMAFTADNKRILYESRYTELQTREVETGDSISTLDIGYLKVLAYSNDCKLAVMEGSDEQIRLWDLEKGKEVQLFRGHADNVRAVKFSPDDQFIITGSEDYTAKLWEVDSGLEVRTFNGHTGEIAMVTFSPDGQYLLTGGFDSTTRLWDVQTGYEIRKFNCHPRMVQDATVFTPDGQQMITNCVDYTAKRWILQPDLFVAQQQGLATFSIQQILLYNLDRALKEAPGAWERFLATSNWQQLHSFALFYTQQATNNNNLAILADYYTKAQQCYQIAREQHNTAPLIRDQANILLTWAKKLLYAEEYSAAKVKIQEAISLYQELLQKTTLYNSYVKAALEELVEQGLSRSVVADFLTQLN